MLMFFLRDFALDFRFQFCSSSIVLALKLRLSYDCWQLSPLKVSFQFQLLTPTHAHTPTNQGWPDFFSRGPNLQENKYCGPQKTYQKKFWACFLNLRPQNRPHYGVLLQNYAQKQKSASLKFVTGSGKKL